MNKQPANQEQATKEKKALLVYLCVITEFQLATGRKQPDAPLAEMNTPTDWTDFANWLRAKAESQTRAGAFS